MHAPAAFCLRFLMRAIGALFSFSLFRTIFLALVGVCLTVASSAAQSDITIGLGETEYGWRLVAVPESHGGALQKCTSLGWRLCQTIGRLPPGSCASYVTTPDGQTYQFAYGNNFEDAKQNALKFCRPKDNRTTCTERWAQCNVGVSPPTLTGSSVDGTYFAAKRAVPQQSPEPPPVPESRTASNPATLPRIQPPPPVPHPSSSPMVAQSSDPPPSIKKQVTPVTPVSPTIARETGIIEFRYLNYLSLVILSLLLMWLLWARSIRTPPAILRSYLSVALWSGLLLFVFLPSQASFLDASLRLTPPLSVVQFIAFWQLYALVYLLLYVGNRLRAAVGPHATGTADHVFLRLPALTVVIPLALALYTAQHQFKQPEEIIICSFLAVAVFGIGYFIQPYQVAQEAAPDAEAVKVQEPQTVSELSSQVTEVETVLRRGLPAVISPATEVLQPMPPLEGIVLRLKRSQKKSTMGNIIYMLDARIDASQETLDLISRHRLGGRLIYESEARQKHAANAQGHLANTRGGPSLLAPASEQAMGVAKTMWKLGRAAVSAVRASLALRITVNSLLSGVHVECKDMEELLEAEAAIREAKENLEGFIETAQTFDGREEIH
jgi:Domain of unknown function (DUF4189)